MPAPDTAAAAHRRARCIPLFETPGASSVRAAAGFRTYTGRERIRGRAPGSCAASAARRARAARRAPPDDTCRSLFLFSQSTDLLQELGSRTRIRIVRLRHPGELTLGAGEIADTDSRLREEETRGHLEWRRVAGEHDAEAILGLADFVGHHQRRGEKEIGGRIVGLLRHESPEQVRRAFVLARAVGFDRVIENRSRAITAERRAIRWRI